jgi:hypothetical protein
MSPYRVGRTQIARLLCSLALLSASVSTTGAQEAPPPYLAIVEGAANLDREGDVQPAAPNTPLVPGDRVSTLRGRVEVLFPDGSALDLDEYSTVELVTPIRITVAAGRVIFVVPGDTDRRYATRYEIDTPTSTIVTSGFGTYRADAGSAASAWAPDAFDQWAQARYAERTATASGQYLPSDLRVHGSAFDRNGQWQYDASSGYVWYPAVTPDWRPYYNGYWEPIRPYGWTWIGTELWSWPTHHYGRWGHSRIGWYWIPGRTFGPAWVSWGAANGYVSWCPLGFDNRPVFAFSLGSSHPSPGWVVVPRTHFGIHGAYASRYAVAPHHVPPHTAFVTQSVPPIAVPRDMGRRALLGDLARRQRDAVATQRSDAASRRSGEAGGMAVPRNRVAAPAAAGAPLSGTAISRQLSADAQPRHAVPAVRSPQMWDPSRSSIDTPRAVRLPDQRSMPVVPRVTPPISTAVPRVQTAAPAANDVPRFRSPATMYGLPRDARPPGYGAPQAIPRSMPPGSIAPQAPPPAANDVPRFRSPATMYGVPRGAAPPGYSAPQAMPRLGQPSGIAPSSPGAVPAPPRMAPSAPAPAVAVPRAAPAAPTAQPPAAAPSPAGPSRAAPSRSGSGGAAGDGHAQSRHRG